MNFDFFKIIPPLKNIIFSYLFETHATLFEYILKKSSEVRTMTDTEIIVVVFCREKEKRYMIKFEFSTYLKFWSYSVFIQVNFK